MPDSKKLAIKKRLCDQLITMSTANGYFHDIGGRVYRGVLTLDNNEIGELPALSIVERPEPSQIDYPGLANASKDGWWLHVTGWVTPVFPHYTDAADNFLADTKKCLSPIRAPLEPQERFAPTIKLLGGLIESLEIGGGICRPPDNLYTAAYFILPLKITFIENTENPYV